METLEVAPQERMLNLVGGFWIAHSIYLAAQLGSDMEVVVRLKSCPVLRCSPE